MLKYSNNKIVIAYDINLILFLMLVLMTLHWQPAIYSYLINLGHINDKHISAIGCYTTIKNSTPAYKMVMK